jgi:hypothetical protein
MTLDEMIQEAAGYIDAKEEVLKVNGQYTGESLINANKFITAINYAYKKICREKYRLHRIENKVLDENRGIPISSLSKTYYDLVEVIYNQYPVYSYLNGNAEIVCPDLNPGDAVSIEYDYIPDDLKEFTDVPTIPESHVDHKILCFYAAFHYGSVEDEDTTTTWLDLFNDGFNNIKSNKKPKKKIRRWRS